MLRIAVAGGGSHPFHKWHERRIYPTERFEYVSVNGTFDSLPEIPDIIEFRQLDSLGADSLGLAGAERREWMRERSIRPDMFARVSSRPATQAVNRVQKPSSSPGCRQAATIWAT